MVFSIPGKIPLENTRGIKSYEYGGIYPLVNVYITMENHHAINGKTHYFDWAIFNSYFDITRGY